jgi:hypothetical protein
LLDYASIAEPKTKTVGTPSLNDKRKNKAEFDGPKIAHAENLSPKHIAIINSSHETKNEGSRRQSAKQVHACGEIKSRRREITIIKHFRNLHYNCAEI